MTDSRPLSWDPYSRSSTIFHPETDGDSWVEEIKQEVGGIVSHNKALQTMDRKKSDVRRMASIPLVVWTQLKRDGIADNTARLKAWLNDPENSAFRTRPGKV